MSFMLLLAFLLSCSRLTLLDHQNEQWIADGFEVTVDETAVSVDPDVRAACELLGLDPLVVANEGKLVAVVAEPAAENVLTALQDHPLGVKAAPVGFVGESGPGRVVLETRTGGRRLVELPYGEELPRIC